MYRKRCRHWIGLALIAYLACGNVRAGFVDGHALRELLAASTRVDQGREVPGDYQASAEGIGYIKGVFDAYSRAELLCAPRSMRAGQAMAIVEKFLNENPETWTMPATILVLTALKEPFACK
ncbi:MAG: Rap1a/Tai family immunity protein [Gammaproteobacteria bacterium]